MTGRVRRTTASQALRQELRGDLGLLGLVHAPPALAPLTELDEPFRGMAEKFCRLLDEFRLLTYGQLISRAVAELASPALAAQVHQALRHLIVDEYQDINPAQERLIRLLTGPGTSSGNSGHRCRRCDVRSLCRDAERA